MPASPLSAWPCVLASLPDHPELGESIAFQFTGLLVVFTALGLIWLSLTLVGGFFRRRAAAAPSPVPAPAVAPAVVPAATDLPPELVAVIAAAVQVSLTGAYRIQAIVPVGTGQDWAHEGRRQIFASHQVR